MNISSLPRIVAICGDPGGASAVAPVIELLRAEGKVSVTALAYLQAVNLWSERGIQFDTIKGEVGDDDILRFLNEPKANLLLTGTSVNLYELEKRFIEAARQLGIPSMSVLDFWSNYALRLSDDAGNLRYVPDRIAVMDVLARDEMVAAGIADSSIVITGHPALDSLAKHRHAFTQERKAAVRQNFGVATDDWLILYASQPPTFSDLDDAIPPPWLDRLRTINALLGALASLAKERGKSATLLIRPHPRENGEIYRGLAHNTVRIVVSGAGDSRDLALAADVIVGMNTMFLVEACHLGRPTLSIRLDLPLPDDFPLNRSGLIRAVYRKEDVVSVMDELLNKPVPAMPLPEAQGNASRNVAQLLYSMLKDWFVVAKLAINGGSSVRSTPFPQYVTIGDEEKRAVMEVLDSTVLSKFLGTWSPDFYGGPRVQKLEREWAAYFGIRHAVSVNSATSGLYAAVGAAGVGPGDEVIVSPYTMTASATAALVYGGIPVFADIDSETFCLSPASIRERITPRTKAIIVVDLFGHPAEMNEIMRIAREHHLVVIEDAAQAPGARYHGRSAGTLADMGVFSLNYHKTIHCGEGGVVVTNSDEFAERLQLIRNHGEVVVKNKGVTNLVNMVGFNYRMTEIEAAIASEQLKKLESLVTSRVEAAEFLTRELSGLPGLTPPAVRPNVRHGYYIYVMKYTAAVTGVPRERFATALRAEGIPLGEGYVEPIYLQPMYQQRIAFGKDGFPFTFPGYRGVLNYERGICPVTERMHFQELIVGDFCHANMMRRDLEDIVCAFRKVTENISELA